MPAPGEEGEGWKFSFSAGTGGSTREGEERSIRKPYSIQYWASECCGGAVTWGMGFRVLWWGCDMRHRFLFPHCSSSGGSAGLQEITAAALPTGSAHPQHADRWPLMVHELRWFGVWCFNWGTFALASFATKATAVRRGACETGSAWNEKESKMSLSMNCQSVPHNSLRCFSHSGMLPALFPVWGNCEKWKNRGSTLNVSSKAE